MKNFGSHINWKILGSLIWLILTFSLISWWFIFVMNSVTHPQIGDLDPETLLRRHRMIFWEGGSLLVTVLLGGGFLVWYTYVDQQRATSLKEFFSHFAHDLKTSMARVQLRAEVLAESFGDKKDAPPFHLLLNDIKRLHLQLENSLLMTHLDEHLMSENINLNDMITSLQREYEEIQIKVAGQAWVKADSRALRSLLRNVVQNSIVHGAATELAVKIESASAQRFAVTLSDNGAGSQTDLAVIGRGLAPAGNKSSSYGIGLFLAQRLVKRMRGEISFGSGARGFEVRLQLPAGSQELAQASTPLPGVPEARR